MEQSELLVNGYKLKYIVFDKGSQKTNFMYTGL